jgi:hypothetical protein
MKRILYIFLLFLLLGFKNNAMADEDLKLEILNYTDCDLKINCKTVNGAQKALFSKNIRVPSQTAVLEKARMSKDSHENSEIQCTYVSEKPKNKMNSERVPIVVPKKTSDTVEVDPHHQGPLKLTIMPVVTKNLPHEKQVETEARFVTKRF